MAYKQHDINMPIELCIFVTSTNEEWSVRKDKSHHVKILKQFQYYSRIHSKNLVLICDRPSLFLVREGKVKIRKRKVEEEHVEKLKKRKKTLDRGARKRKQWGNRLFNAAYRECEIDYLMQLMQYSRTTKDKAKNKRKEDDEKSKPNQIKSNQLKREDIMCSTIYHCLELLLSSPCIASTSI